MWPLVRTARGLRGQFLPDRSLRVFRDMSHSEYLRVLERRRDRLASKLALNPERRDASWDRAELTALNWVLGRFQAENRPEARENA